MRITRTRRQSRVLAALPPRGNPMSEGQIARRAGLPVKAVNRRLHRLYDRGGIKQSADGGRLEYRSLWSQR